MNNLLYLRNIYQNEGIKDLEISKEDFDKKLIEQRNLIAGLAVKKIKNIVKNKKVNDYLFVPSEQ